MNNKMDNTKPTISWVQLNNTVVPVIHRHYPDGEKDICFVPLPVLQYGSGLLNHSQIESVPCTSGEASELSHLCVNAGFNVTFSVETRLIELDSVPKYSKQKIIFSLLPDENPVDFAQFRSSGSPESSACDELETISDVTEGNPDTKYQLLQHENEQTHNLAESLVIPIAEHDHSSDLISDKDDDVSKLVNTCT